MKRRALLAALAFAPATARAQLFNPGAPLLAERNGLLVPGGWSPANLGASLLAWWDAERSDLITQSGGLVSSWRDIVGSYNAVQATGAAQPIYGATSFNGRPGVTFDGTDDELTAPFPASFQTAAIPGEIWAVTDQTALPADTGSRMAASMGAATTNARSVERTVTTGVNRARVTVGDGVARVASVATVDFSGRHVIRNLYDGVNVLAEVDGTLSAGTAVTAVTTGQRVRLGASAATTASLFWKGTHSAVLFTAPLSAQQATDLRAFLTARL